MESGDLKSPPPPVSRVMGSSPVRRGLMLTECTGFLTLHFLFHPAVCVRVCSLRAVCRGCGRAVPSASLTSCWIDSEPPVLCLVRETAPGSAAADHCVFGRVRKGTIASVCCQLLFSGGCSHIRHSSVFPDLGCFVSRRRGACLITYPVRQAGILGHYDVSLRRSLARCFLLLDIRVRTEGFCEELLFCMPLVTYVDSIVNPFVA